MLVALQESYHNRDFAVLGVALDDDGWKVVKPFVDERRINYRVMVADNKVPGLYGGLKAVPTTLIIDKQGRIAATHLGLCQRSEYEGDIRAVLAE